MDARQLEAVVAVVDEGTVTAAAERLHVSQPALSQTIQALERDLGTALFHRIGRRLTLTPAGEAIVEPARRVLRDFDTVRAHVTAVAGLESGHLDLVSLPTLAVDPVAALIGAFRRAHAGVAVRLAEPEGTAEVIDRVADGRSEVGIADVDGQAAPAGLVARAIARQVFHVVCPADQPVSRTRKLLRIIDLDGLPIVTTPPGSSTRRVIDEAFDRAGLRPSIAVETAQREALLPLVLEGAGITLLPTTLARDAAARGALTFPIDPPVERVVSILHRDGLLSPAAAAFLTIADVSFAPWGG